jgi:hypothetical protein
MKKSQLKALITEVIDEVASSQRQTRMNDVMDRIHENTIKFKKFVKKRYGIDTDTDPVGRQKILTESVVSSMIADWKQRSKTEDRVATIKKLEGELESNPNDKQLRALIRAKKFLLTQVQ